MKNKYKVGDRVVDWKGNKGVVLEIIDDPYSGVEYKIKYTDYKDLIWNKEAEYAFYKEHGVKPNDDYSRVDGFKQAHEGTPLWKEYLNNGKTGTAKKKPGKFWTIKKIRSHIENQVPRNLKRQTKRAR
jgi:hypothetical protein